MIKKILTLSVVISAFTLSACSEVPQGVVGGKKPDEKAYVVGNQVTLSLGKTNSKHVVKVKTTTPKPSKHLE